MPMRDPPVPDDVMMNVSKPEALQQVEIHVMRQMGDALQTMGRSLEAITTKVDDVRERVIRLEEQKATKLVERVERDLRGQLAAAKAEHLAAMNGAVSKLEQACSRIDALESARDQATGAQNVWVWLSRNAAWLFAGAAAFIAGLALKSGLFK
jgi:hypothetical protein